MYSINEFSGWFGLCYKINAFICVCLLLLKFATIFSSLSQIIFSELSAKEKPKKQTSMHSAQCTYVHSLAVALVFCTVWRVACTQDSITCHAYSCTLYASILCSLHFVCEWKCNEEQSSLQIYIIDLCSGPILLFVSKEFSVSKSTYSWFGLLYKRTYQWILTCFKCISKSSISLSLALCVCTLQSMHSVCVF